jgi:hypothetical protein
MFPTKQKFVILSEAKNLLFLSFSSDPPNREVAASDD